MSFAAFNASSMVGFRSLGGGALLWHAPAAEAPSANKTAAPVARRRRNAASFFRVRLCVCSRDRLFYTNRPAPVHATSSYGTLS
ncbi:MAG TPA: hypothetical protein VHL80_04175 [Polyangia bacterium]|nr:hypothetical protein [Polyangia bacterium]